METIKALFSSKKFLMALAGILVVVLDTALGWQIPEETLFSILGLIALAIGAQGVADFGKEAAKVNQETATKIEASRKTEPEVATEDPS